MLEFLHKGLTNVGLLFPSQCGGYLPLLLNLFEPFEFVEHQSLLQRQNLLRYSEAYPMVFAHQREPLRKMEVLGKVL